jgi:hypothetical protein
MKLETLRIDDLVTDPNNARTHDDKNLDAIKGSLSQFGQRKPIVIQDNVVIAGNGTLEAARQLGWKEIEVVRVPDEWTPDQAKAFALADNRTAELAQWNHDVLSSQILELQDVAFPIQELGFEIPELPTDAAWTDVFDATAGDRKEVQQITFTLHTDQAETVKAAIAESKAMGEFGDTGNSNDNGNALARIVEMWMGNNER